MPSVCVPELDAAMRRFADRMAGACAVVEAQTTVAQAEVRPPEREPNEPDGREPSP